MLKFVRRFPRARVGLSLLVFAFADQGSSELPVAPTPARGLIGAIGNTPLIELSSLSQATGCTILAKAEHLNPGGSVKDRAAKFMVVEAEKTGKLVPGKGIIVEGTGGNTGVGLALVAAAMGYGCICVMPETISPEKIKLIETLGAKAVLQPLVPFSDPRHYYHTAERLARETPYAIFTNQFENLSNYQAHYTTTGPEIWKQSGGKVDAICTSAGTGGTISGLSNFFKDKNPNFKAFVIDPPGSGLYNYINHQNWQTSGTTIAEGIGIARLTNNFKQAKVDGCFRGEDQESVEMAYYLLRNEGLWVGPSSALNVVGAVKTARLLGPGKVIIAILCDGGDRYRTTLYDKKFLEAKGLSPVCTGTDVSFVK